MKSIFHFRFFISHFFIYFICRSPCGTKNDEKSQMKTLHSPLSTLHSLLITMEGIKLTIALVVAILLQWTLRNVAEPLAYVDFPLIIVVYAALQRNSVRAILFGTIAGLAVDALSGGLLGANGFAKTLIAYIVSEIARRVYGRSSPARRSCSSRSIGPASAPSPRDAASPDSVSNQARSWGGTSPRCWPPS